MLASRVPTPLPPGARIGDLPRAQGSIQLSRAPVLAEDQDAFLKSPAASRYGGFEDAADLLLRKSQAADDWPSDKSIGAAGQRWLPSNDRALDYDRLGARLEPDTIYNLDKPEKSAAAALDKSDAADAEFYRLGAAAAAAAAASGGAQSYADRDPDSAPPAGAYDSAGFGAAAADWAPGSQRQRQRIKQLAAVAAAAASAPSSSSSRYSLSSSAAEPWRPRTAAADIGDLDLPSASSRRKPWRKSSEATKAPPPTVKPPTRRPSAPSTKPRRAPPPPPPRQAGAPQSQAELAELMENYRQSRTAVVALALGLGLSLVAVLFLTCRIRQLRARFRRGGKALTSDEADYLINGMYL